MALRVVQWTTGNVGRRALRAIAAHPALELVGVFAHGGEKVGRDQQSVGFGHPIAKPELPRMVEQGGGHARAGTDARADAP
jgi:hypothetical protein